MQSQPWWSTELDRLWRKADDLVESIGGRRLGTVSTPLFAPITQRVSQQLWQSAKAAAAGRPIFQLPVRITETDRAALAALVEELNQAIEAYCQWRPDLPPNRMLDSDAIFIFVASARDAIRGFELPSANAEPLTPPPAPSSGVHTDRSSDLEFVPLFDEADYQAAVTAQGVCIPRGPDYWDTDHWDICKLQFKTATCSRRGCDEHRTQLHHKNYLRYGNERAEDFEEVCHRHHEDGHGGFRRTRIDAELRRIFTAARTRPKVDA